MEFLTLDLLRHALLYLLVPAWLLVGLAGYLCRRAQRIEETGGVHESLLHLGMLAALVGGVFTAMFYEINAATLWILLGACLLHEAILVAALFWADETRGTRWYEQWVRGMQQALPWMGLAVVMLLHPTQALAMFSLGDVVAEWQLVWKRTPLPEGYLPTVVAAGALLVGLPFLEEAGRCLRTRMQRRREVPAWKVR